MSLACVLGGCSKQIAEAEPEIGIKEAAVKGELLVRFAPDVADALEKAGDGATKAGVSSVDQVLQEAGVYQIERVFPYNASAEERTRESGLHLWYVVRFDQSNDIETVGRALAKLGQVSGVQYNHTIKRAYNAEKRAIPFDPARAGYEGLTKSAVNRFNDPYMGRQWNLVNHGDLWSHGFLSGADVNVEQAWDKCTGDPSVIVAVVDEGVFYDHPDLAANMWHNEGEIFGSKEDNDGNGYAGDYYGYNFVSETGLISYSLSADTGHGSHVAGCIAAVNNNGVGISSIAGGNNGNGGVRIMSCQIFSGNLVASILAEVRAMKYAADNGAVILQCSWGYTSSKANPYDWSPQYGTDDEWMAACPVEKDALFYFIHTAGSANGPCDGGIAVFAGGNESASAAGYPGAYGDCVSVIGTAPDYTPAVYTNFGTGANICAPGGDQDYFYDYLHDGVYGEIGCILSCVPYHISESGYASFEGSSMATPQVSAALSLAISYAKQNRRHLTADQYKELLYSTATPLDDYMTGSKQYYKYVADLGQNQLKKMELDSFKGKMGAGQVNVSALLAAVEGAGVPMRFPNVFVGVGEFEILDLSMYFDSYSGASCTVTKSDVASVSISGGNLTVNGLSEGVTSATLVCAGKNVNFTITVKNNGNVGGWMR